MRVMRGRIGGGTRLKWITVMTKRGQGGGGEERGGRQKEAVMEVDCIG